VRVCAIDIGTSSVRGLVADLQGAGRIRVVHREGEITHLGQMLSRTGFLIPPAIQRTAEAVEKIVAKAKNLGAERFKLVATSAARHATNPEDLKDRIRELTSLEATVISGLEEARYICEGVLSSLDIGGKRVLMADLGGGSTELIFVRPGEEPVLKSVHAGALTVTESFFRYDPPLPKELSRAFNHARDLLREACAGLLSGIEELIGLGGTITTIPAMLMEMEKYDPARVHNYVVPREEVEWTLHRLAMLPLWDRTTVKGLEVARAGIIVGGLVIVKALLEVTGFDKLRVSDEGILLGIVLSMWPGVP